MMICPADRTCVVSKVEQDWEWVTIVSVKEESSEGPSVVDDDCEEFQHIDRDKVAVRVVSEVELSFLNDFVWPGFVPPKLNLDAKSTAAVEAYVA